MFYFTPPCPTEEPALGHCQQLPPLCWQVSPQSWAVLPCTEHRIHPARFSSSSLLEGTEFIQLTQFQMSRDPLSALGAQKGRTAWEWLGLSFPGQENPAEPGNIPWPGDPSRTQENLGSIPGQENPAEIGNIPWPGEPSRTQENPAEPGWENPAEIGLIPWPGDPSRTQQNLVPSPGQESPAEPGFIPVDPVHQGLRMSSGQSFGLAPHPGTRTRPPHSFPSCQPPTSTEIKFCLHSF